MTEAMTGILVFVGFYLLLVLAGLVQQYIDKRAAPPEESEYSDWHARMTGLK